MHPFDDPAWRDAEAGWLDTAAGSRICGDCELPYTDCRCHELELNAELASNVFGAEHALAQEYRRRALTEYLTRLYGGRLPLRVIPDDRARRQARADRIERALLPVIIAGVILVVLWGLWMALR